ncbi:MAG TPA: DUF2169 domain-containing protein [Archangium sp.]|nr:DUF2169 domain-containing protein [Archangium sp.]
MDLFNSTPFVVERFVYLDSTGRESLTVVIKATFILRGCQAILADEQIPLSLADEYCGKPEHSSVLHSLDLAPFKPATDVLLSGFAYPQGRSKKEVLVAFRLGGFTKGVQVMGDRVWDRTLGMATISSPCAFERMELTYERAFGGTDLSHPEHPERCEENPVGRGFRAVRSKLPIEGMPLPNIEDPLAPIHSPGDRPKPRAFGPLAPHWHPRALLAGTYDKAWERDTMPLLPKDFDERFFQAAPSDQILPAYVQGGEPVKVVGTTPEGALEFSLPSVRPEVVVRVGSVRETPLCLCDTVSIQCEQKRLMLVWRARLDVHGRIPSVQWIKVQQGGGLHAR